ncbi:MAG TPA: hypothetical protein VHE35_29225 [Kofleriaceae bacterium]|nr:hypothetical protein [Kofleriaceae bacterium]
MASPRLVAGIAPLAATFAVGFAAFAVAACGGHAHPVEVGSHTGGGAGRGPVMVFIGLSDTSMFEAACHDCDALRAGMVGQKVSSGKDTFVITGTVSDGCDASGPNDVTGVKRLSGDPDSSPLGVAVLPAGAPIDLQTYATDRVPAGAGALRGPLARRATADLAASGSPVAADDIVVEQVIDVNVAGDPRPDELIAANVPLPEDQGPGYRWSALVMAPGGDLEHLVSVWTSDLEHLVIDASFDLEGDGVRELIYSSEYYEGGGRGAATITDGKLTFLGTWGCGA